MQEIVEMDADGVSELPLPSIFTEEYGPTNKLKVQSSSISDVRDYNLRLKVYYQDFSSYSVSTEDFLVRVLDPCDSVTLTLS